VYADEKVPVEEDQEAEERDEKKAGWKERIEANYSNRIREWSTPEKLFETFAQVERDGEAYMTLENFRDALIPMSGEAVARRKKVSEVPEVFKLVDVDGDGLISFAEFVFFTTLLAIPEKHYAVAFKMFDTNGDGILDRNEFRAVMAAMRENSALGGKQRASGILRDPRTGMRRAADAERVDEGGLFPFFFGATGDKPLSFEQFKQFLDDIQSAVLRLEFDRYDEHNTGSISGYDFGQALVGYARPHQLPEYRKRLAPLEGDPRRVTFKEFRNYHNLLHSIPEIVVALKMYGFSKGAVDKAAFRHAVRAVADVELTTVQLDVIFQVFDEDGDGSFDFDELIAVAAKRSDRGLTHPRDVGLTRVFSCVWKCVTN
jgi:calcium uptake protein 1, mitochondrial